MGLFSNSKKAYWTKETHLFRADEYVCSACGYRSGRAKSVCPGCGAKMTKEKYSASWVDEAELMSAVLDDDW